MQPQGELRERKSKEMKGDERKMAFIFFHQFLRIGAFQRVTAGKNKKSGALSTRL
jgi:hypothetical protein